MHVHAATAIKFVYEFKVGTHLNKKNVIGTRQVWTYLLRTMKCKIKIMYHITHLGRC